MAKRHVIQIPKEARVDVEPRLLMLDAKVLDRFYLESTPITGIFSESLD
jgi:hypothetical protein